MPSVSCPFPLTSSYAAPSRRVWDFALFSIACLSSLDTRGSFNSQLPRFGEFRNLDLPEDKRQEKGSYRASRNHGLFFCDVLPHFPNSLPRGNITYIIRKPHSSFLSIKIGNSVHSLQQQLTFPKRFASAGQTLC